MICPRCKHPIPLGEVYPGETQKITILGWKTAIICSHCGAGYSIEITEFRPPRVSDARLALIQNQPRY